MNEYVFCPLLGEFPSLWLFYLQSAAAAAAPQEQRLGSDDQLVDVVHTIYS